MFVIWSNHCEKSVDTNSSIIYSNHHELLKAVESNSIDVPASQLFAIASIKEGAHFINLGPQNTLTKAIVDLAEEHNVYIIGNDFGSYGTNIRNCLFESLISQGIVPLDTFTYESTPKLRTEKIQIDNTQDLIGSIHSMNPNILSRLDSDNKQNMQWKRIISKSDNKKTINEIISHSKLNGTLNLNLTCSGDLELIDSVRILDLIMYTELLSRIQYKTVTMSKFQNFDITLPILSHYFIKPYNGHRSPCPTRYKKYVENLRWVLEASSGIFSTSKETPNT